MKVRKWLAFALAAVLLLSLAACGGNSAGTDSAEVNYAADAEMEKPEYGLSQTTSSESTVLPQNRKLIQTVRIDAETEALDELLRQLDGKIAELGGYVENREVYNGSTYSQRRYRSASMTIRIPAEQVDSFVEHVDGTSNIVSSNESIEDITLQYVDTDSRVKALETEQERLLALLEQAKSLDEILEIEDRLTDVRYELERYASQLRTYDNLVSYATVHLNISEVQEYTPVEEETLWQRISGGFMSSLKGIADGAVELLVWVLVNSPYLVLCGAVAVAVILLIRKRRKPKAKKTEEPKQPE